MRYEVASSLMESGGMGPDDERRCPPGFDPDFLIRVAAFVFFFPLSAIYVVAVWVVRKRKRITQASEESPP